ncbi:MAG TPA: TetR/AcrR family transcriptional regulator [Microlunatus sp.]|nr:TetR/AcrR family transcriptional regulator [Microlunatus sp.]
MSLGPVAPRPEPRELSPRTAQIVTEARELLERGGPAAMTMRRIADRLAIRAPSLYKHLPGKASLEALVIESALFEIGDRLHGAVDRPGRRTPVAALLVAYRRHGLEHPNLYRLVTSSGFPSDQLLPGLEEWAGEPFYRVVGEPYAAQALWSFAHGTMILELDDRFLAGSQVDRTWAAGVEAFDGIARKALRRAQGTKPER